MKKQWLMYLVCGLLTVWVTGCVFRTDITPDFSAQDLSGFYSNGYVQKAQIYYLVVDASASMADFHNKRQKLDVAKEIARRVNATIPTIPVTAVTRPITAGARVFGPENEAGQNTELLYGMINFNGEAINTELDKITIPGGVTPIGHAIDGASFDLEDLTRRIALIIISDGEESGPGSSHLSAELIKAKYGDQVCIYTIHVGNDPSGRALLENISSTGGCGFSTTAEEVLTSEGMTDFVHTVFFENRNLRDWDGDGVILRDDKCPNTPVKVKVDMNGCTLDSDKDGVDDFKDQCPQTPAGTKVDMRGCPPALVNLDTDKDGIVNSKDSCPKTARGAKVDTKGCWQVDTIYFDRDSTSIHASNQRTLDTITSVMVKNPGLKMQVDGHTSSRSSAEYNMALSEDRADTVRGYLMSKGIGADRISVKGYGMTQPKTSNDSEKGKALNRRVEIYPMR